MKAGGFSFGDHARSHDVHSVGLLTSAGPSAQSIAPCATRGRLGRTQKEPVPLHSPGAETRAVDDEQAVAHRIAITVGWPEEGGRMSAESSCFYVPLGEERFRATELATSPWGSSSQHGGPPAALLGRALESDVGGEDGIFARLTFEILGPIPVGELSVEVKTVRPGRKISLREAALSDEAGRPVMLCRAWHISASPASLPDGLEPERRTLPDPERGLARDRRRRDD